MILLLVEKTARGGEGMGNLFKEDWMAGRKREAREVKKLAAENNRRKPKEKEKPIDDSKRRQ